MKVLLGILLASWVAFATVRTIQSFQSVVQSTQPVKPDTVWMKPEFIDESIDEAKNPPKPSIIERITTEEVKPDTVYVAVSDSTYAPEDLPDYGMQKVEKKGKNLEVTSLRKDGSEAQKHVYTLPEPDSDYLLTSGKRAAMLRASRTWDLVKLEGSAIVVAGAGGVQGIATGPISVNITPSLSVSPAIVVDSDDGASVGVSIHLEF